MSTAVITGASTGIGLQTAIQLARREEYAKIVFAVRSVEKTIRSIPPELESKCVVLYCDLASLESVELFVSNLQSRGVSSIDRLVLNAGINDYTNKKSRTTVDGFDEIWQVNYLAHFYLTCLVKPLLAVDSRIVCLSSVMHWFGNPKRFDELVNSSKDSLNLYHYYSDSKLAMAVLACELNRRLPKTVSIAANPGSVMSDIFRHWLIGLLGIIVKLLASFILLSTVDGARTSVMACSDKCLTKFEYLSPYGQVKGWGRWAACLSDLIWFRINKDQDKMIGECANCVSDKAVGETLWALSVQALEISRQIKISC